jgi:pyridoxine kinase
MCDPSKPSGYKHVAGQVLESTDLRVLIDGLKANDLIDYTYLLTGYIGSKSFQEEVLKVVEELKDACPNLKYGKACSIS